MYCQANIISYIPNNDVVQPKDDSAQNTQILRYQNLVGILSLNILIQLQTNYYFL